MSLTARQPILPPAPPAVPAGPKVTPAAALDVYTGDPNFMTSLARGLVVIQAFTQQSPQMTISQLSIKTGLSRAAVRRCLYTLTKLGFAGAEDGSRYSLRPRMLTLSHTYTTSNTLSSAAQPILERMSATHPRVLLCRHARRRRHRLHRPHPGQSRHGRRPPHRQPSPRLLHQHGPHSPRLSAAGAARAISRQGRPRPPHHPHHHLGRKTSPRAAQHPPQRLRHLRSGVRGRPSLPRRSRLLLLRPRRRHAQPQRQRTAPLCPRDADPLPHAASQRRQRAKRLPATDTARDRRYAAAVNKRNNAATIRFG